MHTKHIGNEDQNALSPGSSVLHWAKKEMRGGGAGIDGSQGD